jgi:hypothetical protein
MIGGQHRILDTGGTTLTGYTYTTASAPQFCYLAERAELPAVRRNSRFRRQICIKARPARLCVSVSGTRKSCQTPQNGG